MKAIVAAVAAVLAFANPAFAQAPAEEPAAEPAAPAKPNKPIGHFFGIFQGPTTVVAGASADTQAAGRESRVEIQERGNAFMVTWSTLYVDEENPSNLKIKDSTEIVFGATPDPAVFRQTVAGELWSGKPYYWARIQGDTLHVSALVLDADGTYDVTHYARSLQGDTMRLDFTRFKDGLLQRHVTGTLKRTAE